MTSIMGTSLPLTLINTSRTVREDKPEEGIDVQQGSMELKTQGLQ